MALILKLIENDKGKVKEPEKEPKVVINFIS